MKYWVYKDSRVLGPFDKDAVSGLPGIDASTLVCSGEAAEPGEGDWRPAGDVAEFSALPSSGSLGWSPDEPPSTFGLLDKLQIESAGLIQDGDYPGAAEDLFQDSDMKKTFGELLTPRPSLDEAELRRAKDKVSEMMVQMEMLYKRVSELESAQTDLTHRLAEKELLLRRQPPPPPPPSLEALLSQAPPAPVLPPAQAPVPAPPATAAFHPPPMIFPPVVASPLPAVPSERMPAPPPSAFPPAPVPAPAAPTAAGAIPAGADVSSEWPAQPAGGAFGSFPSFGAPGAPPVVPPVAPPAASAPAAFAPSPFAPASPAPVDASAPPAAPAGSPPISDKPSIFGKAKSFKISPTVRSFRIVGPEEPAAAAAPAAFEPAAQEPPAAFSVEPPAAAGGAAPPFEWNAPAPVSPGGPTDTTAPSSPVAPPITLAFGGSPASAPGAMSTEPPATGIQDLGGGMMPPPAATPLPAPPATAVFSSPAMPGEGFDDGTEAVPDADAPSTQEVLARLAKPASSPQTAPPRPPRSNKPFLIAGGVLVAVLALMMFYFLHQSKDLKQMTSLDDGRSRVGAEAPLDERPPMVKPQQLPPQNPAPAAPAPAAPAAPAAAEAAQAASQAQLEAAVALVKGFPLDGERGTVGEWLQYSYSANPDAGKEIWSASKTSDTSFLVEYRFAPAKAGGPDVHYLFEAEMDMGLVVGKNLDARNMLAGAPRAAAEKPKPKPKPKARKPAPARAVKRRAAPAAPKEVPLLPLPDSGELRPPAEDDGAFGSDTVNSGGGL